MRVTRLTGEAPRGEGLTLSKVTGQEKKTPAMAHVLLKKRVLVAYILHDGRAMESILTYDESADSMFRTPLAIVKYLSAAGEGVLGAAFRRGDSFESGAGFENAFAARAAERRG